MTAYCPMALDVLLQYERDLPGAAGYVRFSGNRTFATGRQYDRNAATSDASLPRCGLYISAIIVLSDLELGP
jgi:hypothetical protein